MTETVGEGTIQVPAVSPERHRPLPVARIRGQPGPSAPGRRTCGTCYACCITMGVTEIDKPAHTPCPSLVARSKPKAPCGVYETRPASCRGYSCLWVLGMLGEERDRPDKSGIILDAAVSTDAAIWDGIPVAMARETRPGALRERQAENLLASLGRAFVLVVFRYGRDDRVLTGRKDLIEEVERRASALAGKMKGAP